MDRSKPEGISNYIQMLSDLVIIPGDIAEFGCYNGGQTWQIAERHPDRTMWAFDTFEGMPKQDFDPALDWDNPPGKFSPTHDVLEFLTSIPNIRVCKGRFEDTLPTIPKHTVFSAILLDCDYYASCKQVLEYLDTHNHLRPGSAIVFDDYTHLEGFRRAIDEWQGDRIIQHDKLIIY